MRTPSILLLAAALLAPVLLAGCVEGGLLRAAEAPPADSRVEPSEQSSPPARETASPEPEPEGEPEPPGNDSSPPAQPPAENTTKSETSEPPAPRPPRIVTYAFAGNLTTHAVGLTTPASGNGTHAFPVDPDALRVIVTLDWNATLPADLDAVATSPRWCANATAPGEPAGRCAGSPILGEHAQAPGWHQAPGGDPSAPDAPSVVDLDAETVQAENVCEEPPCVWQARVFSKGPAANLAYTLRVDVHYPASPAA